MLTNTILLYIWWKKLELIFWSLILIIKCFLCIQPWWRVVYIKVCSFLLIWVQSKLIAVISILWLQCIICLLFSKCSWTLNLSNCSTSLSVIWILLGQKFLNSHFSLNLFQNSLRFFLFILKFFISYCLWNCFLLIKFQRFTILWLVSDIVNDLLHEQWNFRFWIFKNIF